MNPGEIVLIPLVQFGGAATKLQPALILATLPGPYQNLLLCGISTQLQSLRPNWDELIRSSAPISVRPDCIARQSSA